MVFDAVWMFVEINLKTDFFAHSKTLFVYALLQPMSYAQIFSQIKGLMKINNRSKFISITFVVCLVKNVQSFAYWFSIHETALFG